LCHAHLASVLLMGANYTTCEPCHMQAVQAFGSADLTEYFGKSYQEGHLFEEENYAKIYDGELHLWFYEHRYSGIKVWCEALDLRLGDVGSESVVLFHYANRDAIRQIADKRIPPVDVFLNLVNRDITDHAFGSGLTTAAQEPDLFGEKDDALVNFFWPRNADVFKSLPGGNVKSVEKSGNPISGPSDPANLWVCAEVLEDERYQGAVDYCIPLLVSHTSVYPLGLRVTPDLAGDVELGCNRWGEKQWDGRDICMVHFDEGELGKLCTAAWTGNTDILNKRVECLEHRLGPEHIDTIRALSELAAFLQASGSHEEAKPLVRRVLAHEQATPQMAKRDPRDFSRCLHKVISHLDGQAEAEMRLRRIHSGCQQILGPKHSFTFTALVDLAILLQATGKVDEAETLLGSVLDTEEVSSCFDSPTVLKAMHFLAMIRAGKGKRHCAAGLLQRALALAIQVLEPSHPQISQTFMDLSALQRDLGAEDQARQTLVRAVNHCETKLGLDHDCTVSALVALAMHDNAAGRFADAERLFRQVVDIQQIKFGDLHPDTVAVVKYLVVFLKARNRQGEAAQLLESLREEKEEAEDVDLRPMGVRRRRSAVDVQPVGVKSTNDVWSPAFTKVRSRHGP